MKKQPNPWSKYLEPTLISLNAADPKLAATILSREHPQTIAVALAHTNAEQAAQILRWIPESIRQEAIVRIARLERVDAEQIAELDETMHRAIQALQGSGNRKIGGKQTLVSLLGQMPSDEQKNYLDQLEVENPELSEQVASMLVTMNDIGKLDERSIQKLITEVKPQDWAPALRTVKDHIRNLVVNNLPERRAQELEEELQRPRKIQDVRAAQARIIEVLKRFLS